MELTTDFFSRRIAPWLSLAAGVVAVVVLRRGPDYAPIAVGILLAGWWAAAALARWMSRAQAPDAPAPGRTRRWLTFAAGFVVTGLYQNVLFFLVPLWFASASLGSINLAFPLLLAGMALFSCFDHLHRRLVLDRPAVRSIWSALILFATLVPAAPVLAAVPLRWAVAAAAGLSVVSALVVAPRPARFARRLGLSLAAGAGAAALGALLAVGLPPVPVQCLEAAAGTGVEQRVLVGQAEHFAPGGERIYAWFAVAAPPSYHQQVRFEWSCNGQPVGRPFETQVVGGREAGFRTFSYVSRPWPGAWRADLYTTAGQLIGRVRFEVGD